MSSSSAIDRASRRLALEGLFISVIVSLLIYGLLVVRPALLLNLYDRPLLDLLAILQTFDPYIQTRLIVAFILLAVMYGLGWWSVRRLEQAGSPAGEGRSKRRVGWAVILAGAAAAAAILLYLYPFDAADIFDNIAHGRILGVYGKNPFVAVPADFPDDPFLPYVAWADSPSAYGPLWETLAGLTARLVGNGVVANVLGFKLLPGLFAALSVFLVYVILNRRAPDRAMSGVWLLAWNPLVLYETFGHGHNDVVMAAWILAAVWAMDRRRFTLAVLALLAGTVVKYIPVLLLPAAGVIALRDLPNPSARVRYILGTTLAGIFLLAVLYAPFWNGVEILTIERRADMFTTSLPSILFQLLSQSMNGERVGMLVSEGALVFTGAFALWQAYHAETDRSWLSFPRAALNVLFFFLLVTILWFQQWYMVWVVGLAALIPPDPQWGLALLLSFTAFTKPFVFGPLVFHWDPPKTGLEIELRLSLGVMALSWLAGFAALWKGLVRVSTRNPKMN